MSWQDMNNVDSKWNEVENEVLPIIRNLARRFVACAPSGVFSYEDLVQEGKVALFTKMDKYDETRQTFKAYSFSILRNFFIVELKKAKTKGRMPRIDIKKGDSWESVPYPPVLGWNLESVPCFKTSKGIENNSSVILVNEFIKELSAEIGVGHLKIFKEMVFLDGPKLSEISKRLNVPRPKVIWSNTKIKLAFTSLAKKKKYREIFGDLVNTNSWPLFHKSPHNKFDVRFVKEIIKKRFLDSSCLGKVSHSNKRKTCKRTLYHYPWGTVVFLKRNESKTTFVIEGNFHPNNGLTIGRIGTMAKIPYAAYDKFNVEVTNE